jgi:hypothetical protein
MKRQQRRSYLSSAGFVVLLFACFTLVANAAVPLCVPPSANLVSWWPGEGSALDIIGGNNGTLRNGATFAPGMVGQAFSFDGVDDYVSVADHPSLRVVGAMSIEFWALFDSVPRTGIFEDGMFLFEKSRFAGGVGDDYIVYWRSDLGGLQIDFGDACDGAYHLGYFVSLPTLQAGEFHHYALTAIDGGAAGPEFHVFLDGVEQQGTASINPPDFGCGWFSGPTGELRIGMRSLPDVAPQPFNGLIDEVSIYNRALSASEIESIFNAGSAGKCKPATNTPPTIDAGGPYTVTEGGSVPVTAAGSDPEGDSLTFAWDLDNDGSFETPGQGVAFSATGLTAPGNRTITVQVMDSGGLFTIDLATVQVTYPFSGFFQPVDNLPTLNSVNAGGGIPVKFSLHGNRGLAIFEASYPKSQAIACDTTALIDGIEETVSAGSSNLSYNTSSDQYTYVWKTDKAWAGTCRQLSVKLDDGTIHLANFNFR